MSGFRPKSLSSTGIDLFLSCPKAFYFAYVERVPMDKTASMWLGTAVHRAIERYHADANADIVEEFTKSWRFCRAEMDRTGVSYTADLGAEGIVLCQLYENDPLPDGESEVSFQAQLPGLDVPLRGYIDLVGEGFIAEHKTGRWGWSRERMESHRQVALYCAAKRALTGSLPRAAIVTVLSRFPSPALTRLAIRPTAEQADRAEEAARVVYRSIVAGTFPQLCKAGDCRYPERCEGRAAELEQRKAREQFLVTAGGMALNDAAPAAPRR
jgi:hypothetical protein